jgi:hypothetical protein
LKLRIFLLSMIFKYSCRPKIRSSHSTFSLALQEEALKFLIFPSWLSDILDVHRLKMLQNPVCR